MKLEYPLNDAMPKIEQRRDQLLAKVFDYKQNSPDAETTSDDDYELLYAYGMSHNVTLFECSALTITKRLSLGSWQRILSRLGRILSSCTVF